MQKLLCLSLAFVSLIGLCEYKHTIILSEEMKNTEGTYAVTINGRPGSSFQFIIGKDQTITIEDKSKRNVDVTVTPKKNIEIISNIPEEVCLTKLTIIDKSKGLQATIEPSAFRTSASGPSFCGDYKFLLTIDKKQLKIQDRTIYKQ